MSRWWSCSSRRVSSGSSQAFCRVVGKLFVEAEQFVVSEFFNIEVVDEYSIEVVNEFFNVKVVDEVFVFAAIRQPGFSRLCPPPIVLQGFKTQDLSLCTYI